MRLPLIFMQWLSWMIEKFPVQNFSAQAETPIHRCFIKRHSGKFPKLTGNHLYRSLFFNERKGQPHRSFQWSFCAIFQITFAGDLTRLFLLRIPLVNFFAGDLRRLFLQRIPLVNLQAIGSFPKNNHNTDNFFGMI